MSASILQPPPQAIELASPPLFELGACCATPAAIELMQKHGFDPFRLIGQHVCGSWGDVHPEESANNVNSITSGYRIMSVYRLVPPEQFEGTTIDDRQGLPTVWVITDSADDNEKRHATTILTPNDY